MSNKGFIFSALVILFSLVSCKDQKNEKPGEKSEAEELSNSPRHHEWVKLSHGDREFEAFVTYPQTNHATGAILLIHENRGLNDWARLFIDKLAEEGYLVMAPDLISNSVEGKKRTSDFESPDAARTAIYDLDPEQVTADLDAAYEFLKNDPASNANVAVVGFCWGGSQAFRYATHNPEISSVHVFYGTAPKESAAIKKIQAPVYGYYGEEDERVNSTIERTAEQMDSLKKKYSFEIYKDAGHAFMRMGESPEADKGNRAAYNKAWQRLKNLLKES
ncbi:carboxymethylenebutenolidase [Christiangramia fulva]|uniref:Carboxymethylenebutenolidase n=1 Tax=Christiangramia fulva TaxID=2126553 RepID=A0A2R3Z919_9FLAO|nr:dienelactone hydrolase family protein [Christiangramia fulva]AVR46702.1 carboxymethylenebutenolidase [Christiangramia fulva]